jgi:hypothetical protein
MKMAIFYTGDIRHNQEIIKLNHQKLFDRIAELIQYNVYWFTKNDAGRGECPYEEGDPNLDIIYRRGQGGAIQVWDFMRSVQRTSEEYILRLRTDVWFTETSIDCICFELKEMLERQSEIAYFGSDWIHGHAGKINLRLPFDLNYEAVVQDFVVLANRNKIRSFDDVIEHLNKVIPNKRRSGNKAFRFIIPHEETSLFEKKQLAIVHRILCQIWLIRKDYSSMPTDTDVCRDYIQSYIADEKTKVGKKQLITPHPMQDAVNWWRSQQGWEAQDLNIEDFKRWQSE